MKPFNALINFLKLQWPVDISLPLSFAGDASKIISSPPSTKSAVLMQQASGGLVSTHQVAGVAANINKSEYTDIAKNVSSLMQLSHSPFRSIVYVTTLSFLSVCAADERGSVSHEDDAGYSENGSYAAVGWCVATFAVFSLFLMCCLSSRRSLTRQDYLHDAMEVEALSLSQADERYDVEDLAWMEERILESEMMHKSVAAVTEPFTPQIHDEYTEEAMECRSGQIYPNALAGLTISDEENTDASVELIDLDVELPVFFKRKSNLAIEYGVQKPTGSEESRGEQKKDNALAMVLYKPKGTPYSLECSAAREDGVKGVNVSHKVASPANKYAILAVNSSAKKLSGSEESRGEQKKDDSLAMVLYKPKGTPYSLECSAAREDGVKGVNVSHKVASPANEYAILAVNSSTKKSAVSEESSNKKQEQEYFLSTELFTSKGEPFLLDRNGNILGKKLQVSNKIIAVKR